jgi:tetratricopeptide (TPR) repeat protein
MAKVVVAMALLLNLWSFAPGQSEWDKSKSIAASQHEIAMLAIKNKQYDKVLPASAKIFSLNFPADRENLLVEHAQIVIHCLIQDEQYDLAHRVLDEALKAVHSNKSKAELYKEKAYTCKKEGKDEQAISFFQKAVELEEATP